MRWGRLTLVVIAGVVAAAAATVLALAVAVTTGAKAAWFPLMDQHALWWVAGATAAVAAAGLLGWGAQRWYDRGLSALVPAVQSPEAWVVDRPAEVGQIAAALRRPGAGTVGITTAVHGAGGFGKTTVAKLVRADRRVLRWFGHRVYWVTLGRDTSKQALAGLVNGLIAQLDPGRAVTFTDARQASEHLAALLVNGPRRLLILDDVWSHDQLAAFPACGPCALLVTTRIPSLAGGAAELVQVDQMSSRQARALLQAGLPPLPSALVTGLVAETGRWPLLLRLVNKILADQAELESDNITAVAEDLLGRLRRDGALQVDQLTGAAVRQLDVRDPDQRHEAVTTTIQASTGLLAPSELERFAELAIFAEDETIPVTLIAALWKATSGKDQMTARALCARLADLALLTVVRGAEGGAVSLHDVIRDYLRAHLADTRLACLHQALLGSVAEGLPRAMATEADGKVTAWWELPEQARYLQEHLIEHMLDAGREDEAERLAADLRWAAARLDWSGPAAPYADLARISSARAQRLSRVLGQAAHLFVPTDPPHSLADILFSRVSHQPDWGPSHLTWAASRTQPALINKWPLPDLPHPALRRILTGHAGEVASVAIAPDGAWLVTGGSDGRVRIWDAASGQERAVLAGHSDEVTSVAIAPDGAWLVTGGSAGRVRIWDAARGQERAVLAGHSRAASVAIAPDGTWLVTGGSDGRVRIWDAASGRQRAVLAGHSDEVASVAIAPDGTWLASASSDRSVRIWDAASGQERAFLADHGGEVASVAIAPDGTWLASASSDRSVQIWDAASGQERAVLAGNSRAASVAIAPDGTWLVTGGWDGRVRIWDAASGRQRAVLTGHSDEVTSVAIAPDGTWLASASSDRSVRIWDTASGQEPAVLTGHSGAVSVAIAPDGAWLASASSDRSVRIWDAASGQERAVLAAGGQERAVVAGHRAAVASVAIAPDGAWLASASSDRSVRIWDAASGRQRAVLTGPPGGLASVAVAPDGTWLVGGGKLGSVVIWDAATGQQRAIMVGHSGAVSVAIAPKGTWLASASSDSVQIWDAATGQQRAILTGRSGPVAIAPDGAWLVTGGWDGRVRIWDAATGRERAVLTGHSDEVTSVAIAPDGTWLASASSDRSVRIWDAATARVSAVMRVDRPLDACAWGPAGRSLAAAGAAGLYYFTFKP